MKPAKSAKSPKPVKTPEIGLDEWLECLRAATLEVGSSALRFDAKSPVEARPSGSAWPGTYIAILGDDTALHLGLSATPRGLAVLARSLLGLRDPSPITEKETVDAVSELMNIIAGKVKSRLNERDGSLRLGLPLYVQGQIQVTEHMEKATVEQRVGPVTCELLVFRNPRSHRQAA